MVTNFVISGGRCILKMDHHCPWINTCVGHANHSHFTAFLFFSICGCFQAAVVLGISLYSAINRVSPFDSSTVYDFFSFLFYLITFDLLQVWYVYYGHPFQPQFTVTTLILCVFALGLSIGVVLAVGMLFYFQVSF